MTELDDAIQEHMAFLVLHESRPFCTNDFLRFECNGKEYMPSYGTVRNKFSKFAKKGIIEYCFNDINAYYSLKGHKFGKKSMTDYHTGGITNISPSHPLYKMLRSHVFDKDSIHNIRLRLDVDDVYDIISKTNIPKDDISQDLRIPYWNIGNAQVQIRIHKTNRISVIIGCSLNPIPLSDVGLKRLYEIIGDARGYLRALTVNNTNDNHIPYCGNWLITLWHFNRDGLKEYNGETFSIAIEEADHIIHTIYSKNFGSKKRIRIERQEYPNSTLDELIEKRLANHL